MASTTKIMTTMLALESAEPDEVVTVSAAAAAIGRVPGGASLGLIEGSQIPLESLLAGLMLVSGNDGAVAVADHVSGDEDAFVGAMNDRAESLGLTDTWFVNSSGLTDDPEHRASPMDLALLAHTAMQHETFARLAGTAETEVEELGRIVSRNELLGSYEGATGVKTGFTSLAGLCLVASAERDGRVLYAVVLDSEASFADATALLDHGFEDHGLVEITGAELPPYRWNGVAAPLRIDESFVATLPAERDLRGSLQLVADVSLPVPAGTAVGELVVSDGDEELERLPVHTRADVAAPTPTHPATTVGRRIGDGLRALARVDPREVSLVGSD